MPVKLTIEDCQEYAKIRGGKCLTNIYINGKTSMLWECKNGHQWDATFGNIKDKNSWCPNCNINIGEQMSKVIFEKLLDCKFNKIRPDFLNGLELDGYNDDLLLAFEFQGVQHYKYIPHFHRNVGDFEKQIARDKLKVELCDGKLTLVIIPYWMATDGPKHLAEFIIESLQELKYGDFIVNEINEGFEQQIIEDAFKNIPDNDEKLQKLREAVSAKGYELIDNVYVDLRNHKYRIKCNQGHLYKSTGGNIYDKRDKRCPHPMCNGKPVVNNDSISEFARKRYFEFIDDYTGKNSGDRIAFRCILNHEITISWDNFKGWRNCKHCFGQVSRNTSLAAIQAIANFHGGELITQKYSSLKSQMEFNCKNGHNFTQSAQNILRGIWCSDC